MSQSSLSFGPEWMRPKSKAPDGKTPLPAVVPNGNKAKMAWSGVAAGKVVTSVPTETKKLSFASAATTAPRKFKKRDLEEPEELRSDAGSSLLAENSEPVVPETLGDLASPLLPNQGGQRFSAEEMLAVWRNMKDKNVLVKTEVNNQSMYQSIHLNTPSLLQKDQNAGSLLSKDREGWSPFKSVSVVTSVESPIQGHQPVFQGQQQGQQQQQYQAEASTTSSAAMSPVTVPSVFDTFNAPAVPPGMGFASPPKLQHPENIKWMYKDYQGVFQGPFAGPVMHTWWKGGHLESKLLIRREDDDLWQTVDELIAKTSAQEPFLTPLPFVAKQPPVINTQTPFSQQFQQPGVPQQQQQQQHQGQHQQQPQPQGPFQGSTSSFQHYPQHLHGSVSSWGSPAVTPMSPTPWGGSQMGGQATPNNNFGGGSFFDQPFHGGHSQSSFFDDRSMWRSGSVSNTMSPALSRASSVIFPNDGPHTPTRAGSHTPLAAAAASTVDVADDNELLELDALPLHLKDVIGDDLEEVPSIKEETPEKEVKEAKKEPELKEEPEEPLTAKERAKRERDAAKKEKKRKEKEEKQRIKEKMAAEKAERMEREAREKAEKARLEQLRIEQEAIDREEAKKAEAEKAERARRAEEERLAKEAREREAPWTAKENKKKERPNKMSLAEIQQLEEVERQKKEAEEQELADAIRAIEVAEMQQESSRDEPSFKPTWATAPVASAPAKSLSQIQKEEEAARKKNVPTSTAAAIASGGVKKYADVLPRRAPAAAPAVDAASPWTTVGAHGKRMGEDGMPVRSQTPTAPAAHMAHQYAAQQAAAAQQQAALAARPPAPVAPAAPKVLTPAESFLQWCHGALRGLNAGVNETELIGMLMTLPAEEESTEIIADIVYANSSTLDGRRFAAEFLKRRKIADGDSAVKWSEVIQHTEVAPQDDGWNTAFKVVGKKKRAP
ncbi:Protein SMY2 [Yarrowia sp. C11]|nr:Protein SMY2 [Yarrowia sp. E02]KAG5371856.1 Protein SMY2 [Yarrowia sp. C11]